MSFQSDMVQTRYIHFRVTNEQFNMISSNANVEGYKTVSNYLRSLALHTAPEVREKINRIHDVSFKMFELLKSMTPKSGK